MRWTSRGRWTFANSPKKTLRTQATQHGGLFQQTIRRANGVSAAAADSSALRGGFGDNNLPRLGERIVVLSTGHAADENDTNPGFADFQNGEDMNTTSAFPADWLAANGGELPNAPGCEQADEGEGANDSVMLTLRVRVPTNANSFSVSMNFFSSEYPEYVCTQFNDFFVTLVDSTDEENPADGNIAFFENEAGVFPVGVNILRAADGLFTQCTNGVTGQCCDDVGASCGEVNYAGCTDIDGLVGTGFDNASPAECGFGGNDGGRDRLAAYEWQRDAGARSWISASRFGIRATTSSIRSCSSTVGNGRPKHLNPALCPDKNPRTLGRRSSGEPRELIASLFFTASNSRSVR